AGGGTIRVDSAITVVVHAIANIQDPWVDGGVAVVAVEDVRSCWARRRTLNAKSVPVGVDASRRRTGASEGGTGVTGVAGIVHRHAVLGVARDLRRAQGAPVDGHVVQRAFPG